VYSKKLLSDKQPRPVLLTLKPNLFSYEQSWSGCGSGNNLMARDIFHPAVKNALVKDG